MRPCDIGANALYSFLKERPPLAPSKGGNARSLVFVLVLELDGTAKQIEVQPGPRIDSAQHPLPAVYNPVQLFGRLPVQNARREPRDRHKLTGPRQAGPAIFKPAPPGQFLGQRSRRVKVRKFAVYVHPLSPNEKDPRCLRPLAGIVAGAKLRGRPQDFKHVGVLLPRPKADCIKHPKAKRARHKGS